MAHANKYPFLHFRPQIFIGCEFFLCPSHGGKKILANFCLYAIKMWDIPSKSQKRKKKKMQTNPHFYYVCFASTMYIALALGFLSRKANVNTRNVRYPEREKKQNNETHIKEPYIHIIILSFIGFVCTWWVRKSQKSQNLSFICKTPGMLSHKMRACIAGSKTTNKTSKNTFNFSRRKNFV